MSEENRATAQFDKPVMDQETYELLQELFQLVRAGDTERLRAFFNMGFDAPNICDDNGNSLLMLASYNGHFETARLLLERGGDPELANDRGQLPLAGAAFKGDAAMARLLIEHGAKIDGCSADGKTALMFAAMFDRTEIIDLLLEKGADSSLRSADGATAFALAQSMSATAAAARLIRQKY